MLSSVTIVIVSYQSSETILATLQAVSLCREQSLAECIVVDNHSTDGTPALVRQHAPWACLVECDRNYGFARGCNTGFQRVTTPYTLFLNPDAEITPDALTTLLNFMERSAGVGIVGPATICRPDSGAEVLQFTGSIPTPRSILPPLLGRVLGEQDLRPIFPGEEPFQTGWICGAVLLVRTDLLKHLGGFDPGYFLYWEETDLCIRARNAGYEIWALGTAVASHIAGASSKGEAHKINGCIARHYYQSRRRFMLKHYAWTSTTCAEAVEWLWLLAMATVDCLRGRGLQRIRPRLQARLFSLPTAV